MLEIYRHVNKVEMTADAWGQTEDAARSLRFRSYRRTDSGCVGVAATRKGRPRQDTSRRHAEEEERHETSEAEKDNKTEQATAYEYHELEYRLVEAVDDHKPTYHERRHHVGHQ